MNVCMRFTLFFSLALFSHYFQMSLLTELKQSFVWTKFLFIIPKIVTLKLTDFDNLYAFQNVSNAPFTSNDKDDLNLFKMNGKYSIKFTQNLIAE